MIKKPLPTRTPSDVKAFARQVLQKMTLAEKIGQLYQSALPAAKVEGEVSATSALCVERIKQGLVGSIICVTDPAYMAEVQAIAVNQSRLGIPLFFCLDVIHGFRTTFPINLALSCSFDPPLIEEVSAAAAAEASKFGIHMTFAPMADLVRDPRWGRVMESSGEDPYLNAELCKAYVRGYQRGGLSGPDSIAACGKHFAAYGAAEAGRDYNTVDLSERQLRQFYLAGYRACVEAGAAGMMSAFNVYDGVPCTANEFLLRSILRDEWHFEGLVISDYNSVAEMIEHKTAATARDAARQAILAGLDVEMVSDSFVRHLQELVEEGLVPLERIDQAALRVLELKAAIGLFDDPFRNICPDPQRYVQTPQVRALAARAAAESAVLLKNDGVLPLREGANVALIGPYARSKAVLGSWACLGRDEECVSLYDGLRARLAPGHLQAADGCDIDGNDTGGFAEAIETARRADIVVFAMGESAAHSGEAKSRSNLEIPGVQNTLMREVLNAGKPCVLVCFSGRPLKLGWHNEHLQALLQAWFPGNESGNALADLLTGRINPSGKLTMSFPVCEGQIPVYYNCNPTGRPAPGGKPGAAYRSCFLDIPNAPLFPFGHGLSYARFRYEKLYADKRVIGENDELRIRATITNIGARGGVEIVQLYMESHCFSVTRPVRELKAFQRISLESAESRDVEFVLRHSAFAFYNRDMRLIPEAGRYSIVIASASNRRELACEVDVRCQQQEEEQRNAKTNGPA
jgi:beta-glucosidase